MFPKRISLNTPSSNIYTGTFAACWYEMMEEECHSHSVWRSDFVQSLKRDDPTGNAEIFSLAAVWSINMVVGSYCFPRYVTALASRTDQDVVRHGLLENAWDESGGHGHTSRSHFWLAVRLARLLGLSDSEIKHIHPLPEAQKYTEEHYKQCAQGDFGFALGMLCLIEEFTTPEFTLIFNAFQRSCNLGMGINPTDFALRGGAQYFTANVADDERHREEMPRLVAAWLDANDVCLDDPTEVSDGLKSIRAGARHSADLREGFFDGIYRFVKGGGTINQLILL